MEDWSEAVTCVVCGQRVCGHSTQAASNKEALRARFHAVVLGAGYSEQAANEIVTEWFPKYVVDIPKFIEMLCRYESGKED